MSLNQLLDKFIGGTSAVVPGQTNSGRAGLGGLVNSIPGGVTGGMAAGGLLGVIVGSKKFRKAVGKYAGSAAALSGTAAIGALAFKAYQNWQNGSITAPQQPAVSQMPSASLPAQFNPVEMTSSDGQDFRLVLVKAMIAAANADGQIDTAEQSAVFEAVNKLQLDGEAKALVFDTLQNPPTIESLAALASGIEQASEIYLASRLAIDPDHPAEHAYLQRLAEQLSLPSELVAQLERQLDNSEANAA